MVKLYNLIFTKILINVFYIIFVRFFILNLWYCQYDRYGRLLTKIQIMKCLFFIYNFTMNNKGYSNLRFRQLLK